MSQAVERKCSRLVVVGIYQREAAKGQPLI